VLGPEHRLPRALPQRPAGRGRRDHVRAPVARVGLTRDETCLLQIVDQGDHLTRIEPEELRAEGRRLVSPVHHVRADAPAFLLVHGEADGLVPFAQSVQLHAALTDAGVEAELVAVPGADHVFVGTDPVPQIQRGAAFLQARLVAERSALS